MTNLMRAAVLSIAALFLSAPGVSQPTGKPIAAAGGYMTSTAIYCDDGTGKAALCPLGSGGRAVMIVTSDTVDLTTIPRAIYVGTGGDISMIGADAPVGAGGVTWKNVPAGSLIPFRARRVRSTGTTAADLLAVF